MRLTQYLTEYVYTGSVESDFDIEYIWGVLQKDCKPYIKQLKGDLLYRGSYKSNPAGLMKVTPRKDRKPMSINPIVQITLDKFFNKKFGWKARSTGVFCTGDFSVAGQYGNTAYSFWPIGPFKFLWHPQVPDLFEALWDIQNTWGYWIDHPEILESFVKDYTNKNFQKAIKSKHEIMISCKNYYLVRSSNSYDAELIDNMSGRISQVNDPDDIK